MRFGENSEGWVSFIGSFEKSEGGELKLMILDFLESNLQL
jgi:hypothetical protein